MFTHYFKVALRNLIKNKARSIISILGLVAGIFCFTTTNYYGRAFYRGDEVFPEYNRMARIYLKYEGNLALLAPTKDAPAQKEDIEQVLEFDLPEVEYAATFSETSYYNIEMTADGHRNHLYTVAAMNVNADFMHVYPSRFLAGSVEQFTSRPLMALVTRSFVSQLGINEQPVGKTFTTVSHRDEELEHPTTYTIAGVIEDYPAFTSFTLFGRNIDMLLLNDGGNQCTFLLNKYIDLENLNNRIIGLQSKSNIRDVGKDLKFDYMKNQRKLPIQFAIMGLIGFLVMLSGVINFLVFYIGAFMNRQRELILRKTLGSSTARLFFLLFTELLITVVAAVVVVIATSELLYPYLVSQLMGNFQAFAIDARDTLRHNLEYGAIILFICAVVAAISVWRRRSDTGRKHRMRNTMLGIQLFIGMFFLIAVGAAIAQVRFMANIGDEGMLNNDARTIQLNLSKNYSLRKNGQNIMQFIQNKEWTEAAGGIDYRSVAYHQGEQKRQYLIVRATPGYVSFIDNKELKKAMEGNEYFCIINQGMQRMLARDSIEGYVPGADGETYPITATIADEHSPRAYVPFAGNELTQIFIRLHATADISKAKEELSAFIGEFLPVNFQFPVHTKAEGAKSMIAIYSFFIWVFAVCAVISILISVLGIYGAISVDTERRQKEVAIRKINGAGMKDIYWLLGRLYVTLYAVAGGLAIIIGWVVLKAMTSNPRWFNEMFNPAQPLLWIGVASTSVFIVFLTVYFRIRKITQINPAEIIKTE